MKFKRSIQNQPRRGGRLLRRAAAILLLCTILSAVALTAVVGMAVRGVSFVDAELLELAAGREPSVLYAYDPAKRPSRETAGLHPAPNAALWEARSRVYVPYEEMPANLVNAFVAIEDKRFWSHKGVDLLRTAHAGVRYLAGEGSFGGSTITQQLVKNLTGDDSHTPGRKLTEMYRALDLERRQDKTRILEAYLNIINLAEGCFGVGAAAERYFSKSVSELTLSQCAVIAAITNHPARYDPITHPEENRRRRDLILREMAAQGYIGEAERDAALAEAICLSPSAPEKASAVTSWYADLVVADVIRDLRERLGYTYEAASMLVYGGGLRIETAMDEELQRVVEAYYADPAHFPEGEDGRPQSGFMLMDPATGDILAVAGAVGRKTANRLQSYATDTRRPAGSCIKPLTVYAPAVEEGLITWASVYEDAPLSESGGHPWPANADGLYRGRVTVSRAVAQSLNPVAVRILEEVGLEHALDFARNRLGLSGLRPAEGGRLHDLTRASLALGQQSVGLTVREVTAAYTAFSDGIYRPPLSYHRVLDREGRVLLENRPADEGNRALTTENAALMTKLLSTVTETEEGTAARYMTLTGVETAGKTGTTQHNCDRWFVGYTPRLLAGVWMGYDYPAPLKGIYGNPCVGIWNDLMAVCEARYKGSPPKAAFDMPEGLVEVEYCPLSGRAHTEACADPIGGCEAARGWFVKGTEPRLPCDVHKEAPIRWVPLDPADPHRIPLLPGDVLTETPPPRLPDLPQPDKRPFFWFFGRRRRDNE